MSDCFYYTFCIFFQPSNINSSYNFKAEIEIIEFSCGLTINKIKQNTLTILFSWNIQSSSISTNLSISVLILNSEYTIETSWFTRSTWPNPPSQTKHNIPKKCLKSFVCLCFSMFFCFLNHKRLSPWEEHNSVRQNKCHHVQIESHRLRKRFACEKGQAYRTTEKLLKPNLVSNTTQCPPAGTWKSEVRCF